MQIEQKMDATFVNVYVYAYAARVFSSRIFSLGGRGGVDIICLPTY